MLNHKAMEFTLKQLSPDNIKLLLEQAFIDIDSVIPVEFEKDGITHKHCGHVWVKDDGALWRITPTSAEFIQFSYTFTLPANEADAPEMVLLKASNLFDAFPVHMKYQGKDKNGDEMFSMIYSQIFPSEGTCSAKQFVKIFRTFQKLTRQNMSHFNEVINIAKNGTIN